jgi:hypothetical protein
MNSLVAAFLAHEPRIDVVVENEVGKELKKSIWETLTGDEREFGVQAITKKLSVFREMGVLISAIADPGSVPYLVCSSLLEVESRERDLIQGPLGHQGGSTAGKSRLSRHVRASKGLQHLQTCCKPFCRTQLPHASLGHCYGFPSC